MSDLYSSLHRHTPEFNGIMEEHGPLDNGVEEDLVIEEEAASSKTDPKRRVKHKVRIYGHRHRRLPPGINLTPLLDVIFNLLFFFLFATTFREQSAELKVRLPDTSTAAPVNNPSSRPTLIINEQGSIFHKETAIDNTQLWDLLKAWVTTGQRELDLCADRNVPYGRVIEVMDLCKQGGMTTVDLKMMLIESRLNHSLP